MGGVAQKASHLKHIKELEVVHSSCSRNTVALLSFLFLCFCDVDRSMAYLLVQLIVWENL